jgi:site-specific recombinase XerC
MIDVKKYKPRTINQRINAINKYLKFIDLTSYCLKTIRIPQCNFIDGAISINDYHRLQKRLLDDNNIRLYLIVTVLGTTGLRISELTKLNVIDVKTDGFRVYSKGDRMRLLYFPPKVQQQLIEYLKSESRYDMDDEPLFLNKSGIRIDQRTIQVQLKRYGKKCHIKKLHPHALRHMFAFAWLDRMSRIKNKGKIEYGVLPMLSQILGHESLETTMIYLRPGAEQIKWYTDHIDW